MSSTPHSNMSYNKNTLTSLTSSVRQGESKRFNCPACGGNNTLSITGDRFHYIYNCYRATCDFKGKFFPDGEIPQGEPNPVKSKTYFIPTPHNTWLDTRDPSILEVLPSPFKESTTYQRYVRVSTDNYIYITWYNLMLERSGYERKLPRQDSRRDTQSKVVRHLKKGDPGIFVPRAVVGTRPQDIKLTTKNIIIVESCLSAIIVSEVCQEGQLDFLPISTGGAQISASQVATLYKHGYRNLFFMLDPDATQLAYEQSKKCSALFNTRQIIPPEKPQDLQKSDLYDIILVYNK